MKIKIKALVLILLFNYIVYSQKNSVWVGHSFTKPEQVNLSFSSPTLKKVNSFGVGFVIQIAHKFEKSKVSFFNYGVELSSVRQGFYLNGFTDYFENTSIKIPVFYSFNYPLSKKSKVFIGLGTKLQFLFGSSATSFVWSNSIKMVVETKGGIFPLLHFNFGFSKELRKKREFNILIGVNKGFMNYQKIVYETFTPQSISTSFFNGTYYELCFNWKLNIYNGKE